MQQKTIELFSDDPISDLTEIISSFEKVANAKVTNVIENMYYVHTVKKIQVGTTIVFYTRPCQ